MSETKDITAAVIDGIQDKKGSKITILDLAALGVSNASKFIICQGKSTSQVAAIADSVRDKVIELKHVKPINYDGYRNSQWIVLDYGDIFVHIFLPETRQFYNLEELWSDAPTQLIPDID
ncbi:MAG: ribosome silencing factor [Prevotella sp.]|nr:ribosome silencing factor [Bacteroides sp.]MCM1366741.1 ribosome silencing factor [Prevotella sp.]MCM1437021.1 ribosome silencing factor [Prevotella sp.]